MNRGQKGSGPECTAFIFNVTSVHQGAALHSREGKKKKKGDERVRNLVVLKTDQSKLTKVLRRLRVWGGGDAQTLHLHGKLH